MKFSLVTKGIRAEKPIEFTLEGGEPCKCVMRAMTGAEEISVAGDAIGIAKKRGVENPIDGHPIYDVAIWACTLAVTCLDPDSSSERRDPYFADAEEVLAGLHTDTIAILFERQQIFQEEVSPRRRAQTFDDLLRMTREFAEANDDGPFVLWSPLTRKVWARTIAKAVMSSPELKSLISSVSEASGATS